MWNFSIGSVVFTERKVVLLAFAKDLQGGNEGTRSNFMAEIDPQFHVPAYQNPVVNPSFFASRAKFLLATNMDFLAAKLDFLGIFLLQSWISLLQSWISLLQSWISLGFPCCKAGFPVACFFQKQNFKTAERENCEIGLRQNLGIFSA